MQEAITEREALNEIARLRRERDAARVDENEACAFTLDWLAGMGGERAHLYEAVSRVLRARHTMHRPGIQNGLRKLEELEQGREILYTSSEQA
jgi:hypothetical protein